MTEAVSAESTTARYSAIVGAVVRARACVPDLAQRLAAAGFDRDNAPDWDSIVRVPVMRKSELPALQAATHVPGSPLGSAADRALMPGVLFLSPGGILEPLQLRSVERLATMLADCGARSGDRVFNGFSYHLTPGGLLFHEALRR